MKSPIKLLLLLAIIISVSFRKHEEFKPSNADVDQVNGCYLFVNSKPVLPYDYLGTVEITRKDLRKDPGSGQYQHVRDLLIKKIKAQYPQAQAIIFNFHDGGTDRADALKFK